MNHGRLNRDTEAEEMDDLKKTGYRDRSKINMQKLREVQCWTKHLRVSKQELQEAVDKVGNSAVAVRKQLSACGTRHRDVSQIPFT